jgi:modulator of FtsH protease HflK
MTMSSSAQPSSPVFALCSAVAAMFSGLHSAARWKLSGKTANDGISLSTGGKGDGPPDLEELWRDMNKKLNGLFGGKGGNRPRQQRQ